MDEFKVPLYFSITVVLFYSRPKRLTKQWVKHSDHTITLWDIRTLAVERDEKEARKLRLRSCKHQPERGGIRRPSGLSPPRATTTIREMGCHLRYPID
jgi:hypothetical protein